MLHADVKLNIKTEIGVERWSSKIVAESTTWHTGEPLPIKKWVGHTKDGLFEGCTYLQADGDELDYIRSKFDNLPIAQHRETVVWTGDLADFIFRNL